MCVYSSLMEDEYQSMNQPSNHYCLMNILTEILFSTLLKLGYELFLSSSRLLSRVFALSRAFQAFLTLSRVFSRFLAFSHVFSRFLAFSRVFSRFLAFSRVFSPFFAVSRHSAPSQSEAYLELCYTGLILQSHGCIEWSHCFVCVACLFCSVNDVKLQRCSWCPSAGIV